MSNCDPKCPFVQSTTTGDQYCSKWGATIGTRVGCNCTFIVATLGRKSRVFRDTASIYDVVRWAYCIDLDARFSDIKFTEYTDKEGKCA